MVKIIGVRFRNAGKVYYFDPGEYAPGRGSRVIVETSRGMECGRVVLPPHEVSDEKVVQPLRTILREADEDDIAREDDNLEKEKEAYRVCHEMIENHGLDMKLVKAEYTFDGHKIIFYFTADERVDFRDLVRDLAGVFRTRIELRQIGVRDAAKILGGIGICGRPLCCSSYLTDFVPVSIRMAKEQNLSLNPAKISGSCGRLMCCLKNEEEAYEYLNRSLPGIGDIMRTPDGREGRIQTVNVLKQTVRVLIEENGDKEIEEHPAGEMKMVAKRRKGGIYQRVEPEEEENAGPEKEDDRGSEGQAYSGERDRFRRAYRTENGQDPAGKEGTRSRGGRNEGRQGHDHKREKGEHGKSSSKDRELSERREHSPEAGKTADREHSNSEDLRARNVSEAGDRRHRRRRRRPRKAEEG